MHIYARGMYTKGTFEIMLPYAGIIRIRFMGMISASVSRGTPASIFQISPQGRNDIVISSAVERSFIRLI